MEEAKERLEKDDENRRKWNMTVYGKDAWDSRLYDIVLNVDRMTIEETVGMLVTMVKLPQFLTSRESSRLLEKKTLLAKVHARVAKHSPKTTVSLIDDRVIALDNLGGGLESDQFTRKRLAENLIRDLELNDVVFHKKNRIIQSLHQYFFQPGPRLSQKNGGAAVCTGTQSSKKSARQVTSTRV